MNRSSLRSLGLVLRLLILAALLLTLAAAPALGRAPADDSAVLASPAAAPAPPGPEAIQQLIDDSQGTAKVTLEPATGMAGFVRLPDASTLAQAVGSPEAQAAAFFAAYGAAFGITDASAELGLARAEDAGFSRTRLTYRQVYQGVDVFAGVLKVHFDNANRITAVNGTFVPGIKLSTTPNLDAAAAADLAVATVRAQGAKDGLSTGLAAADSHLLVFRTGLVQGVPGADHLVYEVEITNPAITVREFVYVDAHTGQIVDQITGIHDLTRTVSEQNLSNVVWSEGGPDPIPAGWSGGSAQQVTDWQNEIDGARETYNLFGSMTNGAYLSYDGADATMRTVNNDPGISCPNANWNGTSTNYCSDVTGDDTVAHEWGHAYTEYTNNLIYQWQSGALNESYSDIWGEVVDFLNGRGTDAPGGLRTAGSCSLYGNGSPKNDNSYRWLSGEDDPAFGGAIRDMWTPTCYGDPGKVTDSQYVCSTTDSGGVHSNSGVPNHGFALMVDGGSYNGQTVSGIGLTKASHIHWEAQNMLTAASNFIDHADALEAACTALTGVNLPALTTTGSWGSLSGEIITVADCQEVADAIAAVEFRTEPTQCNFTTLLDPNAPALCATGETVETISLQDWEAGLGSWTVGTRDVANSSTFDTPNWAAVGDLPAGAPAGSNQAAFVADLIIGDCSADDETGVLWLQSPAINVPAGATTPLLAFDHWVATEVGWDGGNLRASVNGGAWQLVSGSAYTFNAYNSSLNSAGQGNTNPLAGQAAFTGTDGGAVGGSWGQSQVDLSGLAGPGDSIRLRYDFGLDGCNGVIGWYVDNVHSYFCSLGQQDQEMHVDSIDVTKVSQGPWRSAQATVTIVDSGGAPVSGATVSGAFTGPTGGSDSGLTDANGQVLLQSLREKRVTGEWTFCVADVSRSGWTYLSTDNVETCDSTGGASTFGTVTGTVTDSGTGLPIEGASVSSDTGQSTTTAANGTYTLGNVPTGPRTITASAAGYVSDQQTTSVSDGGTSTVNFALDPDPGGGGTGTIKGTVTAVGGGKLGGVLVTTDTDQSATTNRGGKYTIQNVPEGLRTVTASRNGYADQVEQANVIAGQTTTVNLSLVPQ